MPSKETEVEDIYKKKSQLEQILLRPDTYIGSVELLEQDMWIWDFENEKMIKKEISFVPGLYKIFDEILVNASDNKQRDEKMSVIRINIDKFSNTIKVFNNGRGVPVVMHKEEKIMVTLFEILQNLRYIDILIHRKTIFFASIYQRVKTFFFKY